MGKTPAEKEAHQRAKYARCGQLEEQNRAAAAKTHLEAMRKKDDLLEAKAKLLNAKADLYKAKRNLITLRHRKKTDQGRQ